MERSPLYEIHKSLGATFSDYNGLELPRVYSSIGDEYRAAKTSAVAMDRCCVGRLQVVGKDALDLLHRLTTNNLNLLKPGEGMSAALTSAKGRIVEHLVVYLGKRTVLLLTSPQNQEKVAKWIDHYTFIEDVKVEDVTDKCGMISLYGPLAPKVASEIAGQDIRQLPLHHYVSLGSDEWDLCFTRAEAIGGDGFHIIANRQSLQELWRTALKVGARPMGEAAFEILRVEYGIPVYGKELSEAVNPLEAHLNDSVSFNKGCYIGQEVIARLNTYKKVQKYLVGLLFLLLEQAPRPGSKLEIDGQEVGFLTSVAQKPGFQVTMALGYIRAKYASPGTGVCAVEDAGKIEGKVVAPPFPIAAEI
ncbi:MAG: aminomethyl transferase family protein [Chloroflexi bacterium]|nr:aminomethyl transferase family protein [Chloroflexota bacterium]